MSSLPPVRKPKFYFDTADNPSHVTFDDGKVQRRNLPWMHYVESRWEYAEPDIIWMEIGDWVVMIRGRNLEPLFLAIEEHALIRLCAQPDLAQDHEREFDSFATEIRFQRSPSSKQPQGTGQVEFNLGV